MESDEQRFWDKVDIKGDDECWEWTAHRHTRGYGIFWFNGSNVRANRVALIFSGVHPPHDEAMSLHSCHNPPCCNPRHLRWGSAKDNTEDQVIRFGPLVGENSNRSIITDEIAATIYRMRMSGYSIREISAELSLPYTTVENVYVGRSFSHLLGTQGNPTLEELRAKRAPRTKRKAHNSLVTDKIAADIMKARMDGMSISTISKMINMPKGTISGVFSGASHKHLHGVDGNPTYEELRSQKAPNPLQKLSEDDKIEIFDLLARGAVAADIARSYGVSPATISKLKKGA